MARVGRCLPPESSIGARYGSRAVSVVLPRGGLRPGTAPSAPAQQDDGVNELRLLASGPVATRVTSSARTVSHAVSGRSRCWTTSDAVGMSDGSG